jgi:hypothetical protein
VVESHKQQALDHYKGGRGYQPSVIDWVGADQVVGDEFRDGNVPAGMENLRLIKRGFASLPDSVKQRFLRGDSASTKRPCSSGWPTGSATTDRGGSSASASART